MTQKTSSETARDDAPATGRHVGLIFAALMVAMLLGSLDQMIFSTALPTIVGELNGVAHMQWVTTAYLVSSTVMMPIYGKLGDLFGRKSLFVGALAVFLVGSVIGGLAPDMAWLITGRAVQGLGGGGLMILSQAIIADVVPVRQRAKYMGGMGVAFGVAAVAGPLLGGWFTSGIGWRWAFWMNLPLGAIAIALAIAFLKLPSRRSTAKLDVAGIGTMAIAATSLVLVVSWAGTTYAWSSAIILGLIAAAVIGGVAFVRIEQRAVEPIMPMHLFASRNFVLSTTAGLFMGVAMFGTVGYLPTYLQMVTGLDATTSGLAILPMMVGLLVTATGTGQLATRTGRYKWMPIVGSVLIIAALVLLGTLTVTTPLVLTMTYLFVFGAGLGFGQQILVLIVQNAFPDREVGTATAANNFFREIGGSIGGGVVGAVFSSRLATLLAERLPSGSTDINADSLTPELLRQLPEAIQTIVAGAYNDALTPVFLMLVPAMVLSLVVTLFVKETLLRATHDSVDSGSAADAVPAAV